MRLIPFVLAIVMAAPVAAQHANSAAGHDMGGPQETGQSAFAALAEIVTILQADPETDWERVDIDGLRRHLVDMDLLTQEAVVARTLRPEGARFKIRAPPVFSRPSAPWCPPMRPFSRPRPAGTL